MALEYTTRIPDLDVTEEVGLNDEIVIIRKDDLEYSADGSDRKISPRALVEATSVRPSNNLTVSKPMREWIATFRDQLDLLGNATSQATTGNAGVMKTATDFQAQAQSNKTVAVTPANLAALGATDDMQGLLYNPLPAMVRDATMADGALTPLNFLMGMMSGSVFGLATNEFVFKLPVRNEADDSVIDFLIQYGEATGNSTYTNTRPESSPNHTHPFIDVGVTFPQPFETKCLMVIPLGYDIDQPNYDEGSEFVFRTRTQSLNTATFRGSRITGINTDGEQIGVRYIAIGY